MKLYIILAGITATMASAASAADMPTMKGPPPAPTVTAWSWAGPYLGLSVGADWSSDTVSPTIADGGTFPRSNTIGTTGVFGGVTAGYNLQSQQFVYGVELDAGGMGIGGHRADLGTGSEIDHIGDGAYGDATLRLGLAFDQFLLYAKGGGAIYGGSAYTSTGVAGFTQASTGTFGGYTVGGGVEYKIMQGWSVKAEYLHFGFANNNATLTNGPVFPYRNALSMDTAKIGLNYGF